MTTQTAVLFALVVIAMIVIVVQTLAISRLMDERKYLNDEWRRALEGWDRTQNAERHALAGWRQAMDDHERTLDAIDPP